MGSWYFPWLITSLQLILTIKLFKISAAQRLFCHLCTTLNLMRIVSAVAMIFDTIDRSVSDSDLSILFLGSTNFIVLRVYNTIAFSFHQCWLYSEAHSMLLLQFFSQSFSCFSSIFCVCANHLQECSFSRWISRIAFPDSSNSRSGASHLWLALLRARSQSTGPNQ